MSTTLTRRAIVRGMPAAIAAAATATLPIVAIAGADTDPAVELWRRYRANQVPLHATYQDHALEHGRHSRGEITWTQLRAFEERMNERQDPLEHVEQAIIDALEAQRSASPTSIAARLHLAFEFAGDEEYLEDLPWCTLASVVRGLLPCLPADMAAAMAPLARGEGSIGEALMQGGRPSFFTHQSPVAEV